MSDRTQVQALLDKAGAVPVKGKRPRLDSEWAIIHATYDAVAARDTHSATPNAYAVRGAIECDLLTVNKRHRAFEWEVKRTRADFRRDAEKVEKRALYMQTLQQGRPAIRGVGNFIPNRYYMVLCDGDRWLRDEDLTIIPAYASVYVISQVPAGVSRTCDTEYFDIRFHLIKRGKDIHDAPLTRETLDALHRRLSYRVMGNPYHTQAHKLRHDDYSI